MTTNSNGHQPFNPSEHFIQLKTGGKLTDYLPVQWRLVWFREQCPQGTIDTEEMVVDLDREVTEDMKVWNDQSKRYETVTKHGLGYARFKATVTDGKGGRATATKCENAASFADFIEKAETGAVGRALAMLGFGTQFTADELEEQHRIVDTPTMPPQRSTARQQNGTSNTTTQPTQSTPEPAQSDALQAEIAALRTDFEQLYSTKPNIWPAVVTKQLGQIPQRWTPEHLAKMKSYFLQCVDKVTQRRAAQEAVA